MGPFKFGNNLDDKD